MGLSSVQQKLILIEVHISVWYLPQKLSVPSHAYHLKVFLLFCLWIPQDLGWNKSANLNAE